MAKHNLIGKSGEDTALKYLLESGYCIEATNWRKGRAEIDIIAKEDDILVFIEVKTRTSNFWGEPESFISERKEALMLDAAGVYADEVNHDGEIRFDAISILTPPIGIPSITHYKDIFFPFE
jgi:putative endonuclease